MEPSGSVQACNGFALPLPLLLTGLCLWIEGTLGLTAVYFRLTTEIFDLSLFIL